MLVYPWAGAGVMSFNYLFILYNKLGGGNIAKLIGHIYFFP